MKVHVYPKPPKGADPGDGGIRRVVEGQARHLPSFGWEVVDDPDEADVIACHVEIPSTYANRLRDKPFVLHNHGLYWTEYEWEAWHRKVNANIVRAIRYADVTTAVSEWTAAALRRNTARDIRVVYHGVDMEDWEPQTPRGYVLWNKTRVDQVCDPQPLIDLAVAMPEQHFVSTVGLGTAPSNVEVTGVVPHERAAMYVSEASVYLCTVRETFGIGTLEALAAGVPVVGWAWGGQTEIVEHGVDGWLVEPGDVEGLVEGVRWALNGRQQIGMAARAKAEKFPARESARQYAEIYQEVADRYAARAEAPRVSVVVPAYNLDRYLPETLDSVLAQTDGDWECVIVDDASPDRCGEIADEYAERDPRFRVIHNETNLYLAGARNVGIEAARGRYIYPLDADDKIAPGTLATLAGGLDADREFDIAYGNVLFVDEDGVTPTDYGVKGQTAGHSGWPMPFNLDLQLGGPGQLLPYASMFRREVWERVGGYRTRAKTSEDCLFWLGASSYGFTPRMVTRADTLIYRNRESSMSREQGWDDEQHRRWFPWVKDRTLLPAAGRGGPEVRFPSFDPPQIAVVIPVGPDHARYIIDAVDSVEAQTFRGWECIVVNDSGAPLPRLPSWVRVVEPARGRFGGVAAARNAGIAAARALRYLPLDADDFLQPDALDLMFRAHVERDDRPVVYSDFYEDPRGDWEVWETPDSDPAGLVTHGLRYAVTCLTPVEYWRRIGGYDEDLPAWEDWSFQLKLAAAGICTRRVDEPLFSYRKHTGFRRNENMAVFDTSKAAMMMKDFGVVGGELLACKSCPGGRATTYSRAGAAPAAAVANGGVAAMTPTDVGAGDSVLIEYVGAKTGAIGYRGPSGQVYQFAAGGLDARKYVLPADVDYFLLRPGFRRVGPSETAAAPAPVEPGVPAAVAAPEPPVSTEPPEAPAPPLVAPGSPHESPPEPVPAPEPASAEPETPDAPEAATPAPESDPGPQHASVPSRPQDPPTIYTEAELKKLRRSEVDEIAEKVGVSAPSEYDSKAALIDALRARGFVKEPVSEPATA